MKAIITIVASVLGAHRFFLLMGIMKPSEHTPLAHQIGGNQLI